MDELLVFIEENKEQALSVYNEYYAEMALNEGLDMQGDDQYYGDDESYEPEEIYEDFAHCTGHSANYAGARGVIEELGKLNGFDVDPEDEELQWEVLLLLEMEP